MQVLPIWQHSINLFQRSTSVSVRYPFLVSVTSATAKGGGADLIVQIYIEKQEKVNWRRFAVFTSFGFLFCGCWQYYLFSKFMPKLCPGASSFIAKPLRDKLRDARGLRELALQISIDPGINNVMLYFPIFYLIQGIADEGRFEPREAMRRYSANISEDLTAIWSVYVPVQIFNFAFLPIWFRVPFVNAVSFLWTGYWSALRGGDSNAISNLQRRISKQLSYPNQKGEIHLS